MNAILIDTLHDCSPTGGGQRRTSQIVHLARSAGFDAIRVPVEQFGEARNRVASGIGYLRGAGFPIRMSLNSIRLCGLAVQAYTRALSKHEGVKLLVRERTAGVGKVATGIAREFGFRSVAVPQNIESLVPEQRDEVARPSVGWGALRNEVDSLRLDSACVCIAREEQWLLQASGINASHLPYFPIPRWEEELLELRSRRQPSTPRRYLVLGSACNPPVRHGMLELVNIAGPIVARLGGRIDIAGNDTEKLEINEHGGAVMNHGTVSPDKLTSLMVGATAALVFQRRGCGALTKLSEFLISGIPVIANANALRSAYHYQGVHEFESKEELELLLNSDLPEPPVPARPVGHESRFIELLKRLASA